MTLDGEQRYLDSHLSYQRACTRSIPRKFGYSPIQAYMILGAAPIEGRLSDGRHLQLLLDGVHPDVDLRLRRPPVGQRPHQVDPGMGVPMSSF